MSRIEQQWESFGIETNTSKNIDNMVGGTVQGGQIDGATHRMHSLDMVALGFELALPASHALHEDGADDPLSSLYRPALQER